MTHLCVYGVKREDIYKDIYTYKFKGLDNFEDEVTNDGLSIYRYSKNFKLKEVNIINFDIYLKKKLDKKDESVKDSLKRKIKKNQRTTERNERNEDKQKRNYEL